MAQVSLIICSGFHDPEATQQLMADLGRYLPGDRRSLSVYVHPTPADGIWAPIATRSLRQRLDSILEPIIFLAFSAGVLTAASVARHRHYQTPGQVLALFAVDGWGVPLSEPFPVHRLSHDHFTHITSAGRCGDHFYADPAVDHLQLWQRPSLTTGLALPSQTPTTAAEFITGWLAHYCMGRVG
ncbi:hypothetical protein C7271_10085 [filamentous cyanobacterium CCP5]|nr:hypothetical protein C7271_10085 [filamentous cyanobacterium CCP5]